MKKDSITFAFKGVLLVVLAIFLGQCNTPDDNKALESDAKSPALDSTTGLSSADTSAITKAALAPEPSKTTYSKFSLKSTKAVIKGSSSLHSWESNVTQMKGKGSFVSKADKLVAIQDLEIKIEVKSLKSKEGKKMDNKTYDTFNSDKNAFIVYTVKNAAVKVNASNMVTIEASGKLTMAGVSQSVSLTASGKKLPNGDLKLSVSKKLKMTDFKMKPPVMMLNTIKVGDEITVEFDIILASTKQ